MPRIAADKKQNRTVLERSTGVSSTIEKNMQITQHKKYSRLSKNELVEMLPRYSVKKVISALIGKRYKNRKYDQN